MDVVRQSCAVLEGELGLMIGELQESLADISTMQRLTYHRICEGRGNRNRHPPDDPNQEILPFSPNQARNQCTIHSRNFQADQRPHDQEDTMADQQPQLFALPSRYANPQQPEEVLEEHPVQFDLLPLCSIAFSQRGRSPFSCCSLPYGRSFLFSDGISHAIEEREEQRQVDCSRDLGSVLEI